MAHITSSLVPAQSSGLKVPFRSFGRIFKASSTTSALIQSRRGSSCNDRHLLLLPCIGHYASTLLLPRIVVHPPIDQSVGNMVDMDSMVCAFMDDAATEEKLLSAQGMVERERAPVVAVICRTNEQLDHWKASHRTTRGHFLTSSYPWHFHLNTPFGIQCKCMLFTAYRTSGLPLFNSMGIPGSSQWAIAFSILLMTTAFPHAHVCI
jgi:hypothetical protein